MPTHHVNNKLRAAWCTLVCSVLCTIAAASATAQGRPAPASTARTRLVILGVSHSAQLVGEHYQPGYLRAFVDRVHPVAVCVERAPQEFARNDHYEFTYEIQHVVVPYAWERGIAVCPIDWLPSSDDEGLVIDPPGLVAPPFVRKPEGFRGFLAFTDSTALKLTFYFAESPASRAETAQWVDRARFTGTRDFPRRLFLYRTYMQAMRIRAAAHAHPGGVVLVVVGSMHKDDLERTLGSDTTIEIVQPSSYGVIPLDSAARRTTTKDRFAIASFNLLGVQPSLGPVDWDWVRRIVKTLGQDAPDAPELPLLRLRLAQLTGAISPKEAAVQYKTLLDRTSPDAHFTFTGVLDHSRIDSYFDPFGNMTVRQRVALELARAQYAIGRCAEADTEERSLTSNAELGALQQAELAQYWERYVRPTTGTVCRTATDRQG